MLSRIFGPCDGPVPKWGIFPGINFLRAFKENTGRKFFNQSCSPIFIFFNKKKVEKDSVDFDVEKRIWKAEFSTFNSKTTKRKKYFYGSFRSSFALLILTTKLNCLKKNNSGQTKPTIYFCQEQYWYFLTIVIHCCKFCLVQFCHQSFLALSVNNRPICQSYTSQVYSEI